MSTPSRGGIELALATLASSGLDFIVVGMFGINFHARDTAEKFVTEDLDVLLEPRVETLKAALGALSRAGFSFETGGEPFVDLDDDAALAAVIRAGATLRGVYQDAQVVDLMLSMGGFSHPEVSREASRFRALGFEVRVGSLEMLLEAKRRAGRPKDLKFLEYFEAVQASRSPQRGKPRKRPKK